MLMNNLKSLMIHAIISTSAFLYTAGPYLEQNRAPQAQDSLPQAHAWPVYAIILISSLLLYYLTGRMFLEDQFSPSRNLLSVSLIPVLGMVLWASLLVKTKASPFSLHDWKPYLIYIGYTTPLVYKVINSWHVLPFFSWIPPIILLISIRSSS